MADSSSGYVLNILLYTGTSNKKRAELPDEIRVMSRLKGGEVMAYRTPKLLALAWQAEKRKKPVFMVSTEASASLVTVQPPNAHNSPTQKPSVVDLYNHNMNGVDIADQHSVHYAFQRKTRKWWRKVFFWLVETTVVNSYVLYKESVLAIGDQPRSHLTYRRTVLETLAIRCISSAPPRLQSGRPRKTPRLEGDPEHLNQHRECVVCGLGKKGSRHRTLHYCKTCAGNPSLHPDRCFKYYHTLSNFRL